MDRTSVSDRLPKATDRAEGKDHLLKDVANREPGGISAEAKFERQHGQATNIEFKSDGTTVTYADGSTRTVSPDGRTATSQIPDKAHPGQETTIVERKQVDGSLQKETTKPDGSKVESTVDRSGKERVNSTTDANGNKTTYEYDASGNLISYTEKGVKHEKVNGSQPETWGVLASGHFEFDPNSLEQKKVTVSSDGTRYERGYADNGQLRTGANSVIIRNANGRQWYEQR